MEKVIKKSKVYKSLFHVSGQKTAFILADIQISIHFYALAWPEKDTFELCSSLRFNLSSKQAP